MKETKIKKTYTDTVIVKVYDTTTGEIVPVEVSPDVAAVLQETQKEIWANDKDYARNTCSSDAAVYEGADYGCEDRYFEPSEDEQFAADLDLDSREKAAWDSLTPTQYRRLKEYASNGHSLTKIAKAEGHPVQVIAESINAAQKKFQKILNGGT